MKKNVLLIGLGIVVGVALTLVITLIVSSGNGKLKSEDCIGKWEIFEYKYEGKNGDISKYYMPTIEIYKGGTAKGSDRDNANAYHPFNWEIKDDMLVLTETSAVFSTGTSTSYEVKGDIMTSVDGNTSFKKISK